MEGLLETLKRVHLAELERFIYVPDAEQFDMIEHWPGEDTIPDPPAVFKDDCDGFALACRKHLKKLEIPSDLVFCKTETGEGHLVCSVEGWILDNRQRTVLRRDDIPYKWYLIGKPDGQWFLVKTW